jgi:hypothetical protein
MCIVYNCFSILLVEIKPLLKVSSFDVKCAVKNVCPVRYLRPQNFFKRLTVIYNSGCSQMLVMAKKVLPPRTIQLVTQPLVVYQLDYEQGLRR